MTADHLRPRGLDLVAPGRVDRYNAVVPPEYRLPDLGRPDALVVVIGNSRALWPRFIAWLAAEPQRLERADPLDTMVEAAVREAGAALECRWKARFAHEPPPHRVAIQRLAESAGLARIAPTQLCVHPEHGPWISLRAALVVDVAGPSETATPPEACGPCPAACREALTEALARSREEGPRRAWPAWTRVREACTAGGAGARFSDAQIEYHGTFDRSVLAAEVARLRPSTAR